jgi:aldehyde dehydrogenase (NAD+)
MATTKQTTRTKTVSPAVKSGQKKTAKSTTAKNVRLTNTTWAYAAAPESADHISIKEQYDLFINGKFVKPSSKKYFATVSPSTEKKISEVAEANEKDIDLAVKSAKAAYDKTWGKMPGK